MLSLLSMPGKFRRFAFLWIAPLERSSERNARGRHGAFAMTDQDALISAPWEEKNVSGASAEGGARASRRAHDDQADVATHRGQRRLPPIRPHATYKCQTQ